MSAGLWADERTINRALCIGVLLVGITLGWWMREVTFEATRKRRLRDAQRLLDHVTKRLDTMDGTLTERANSLYEHSE